MIITIVISAVWLVSMRFVDIGVNSESRDAINIRRQHKFLLLIAACQVARKQCICVFDSVFFIIRVFNCCFQCKNLFSKRAK